MAPKAGAIRKAGGRPREKNYAAGLPKELIAEKNLITPVPSDEEVAADRDNRLQHIRRLWALRWYQYQSLTPKWEKLFAFKHPWSDVTALKPSWTRASRPPPPSDAHILHP